MSLWSQRVGVVLSGGGSSGIAHVGVLKALEEAQIPIDYITGTSMGALVGGMYAMGYSPEEIEFILLSEEFSDWVFGKNKDRYAYFFSERQPNASWINLKFRIDSVFRTTLPTSIISPYNMDYAFLERTSGVSAAANYNFDSLFVPFRCVAADIHNKAEYIFRSGDVGQAMRASTTYPFYFKPILFDGKLLYDGGLYNNFPADVMYRDFLPDVIIGSTVAAEMAPPVEDDIISQIKNMLMERTSYSEVCDQENMIIIRPEIPKVAILDFSQSAQIIQGGYTSSLNQLPEIKQMIQRRVPVESIQSKREAFRKKIPELIFHDISIKGLTRSQQRYIKGVLRSRKFPVTPNEIRPMYYRLATDPRIKKIYPTARYLENEKSFRLDLDMQLDKDYGLEFGGMFSSRPINVGFLALKYQRLRKFGYTVDLNSYFGRFYSSFQAKGTVDFPLKIPILLMVDFTINNFDYFNSASTFFEDSKPSYLIQYDRSFNTALTFPVGKRGRLNLGATTARMFDDYYQTLNFFDADTSDRTNFNHGSTYLEYERNTFNRKFYPSSGHRFSIKGRYISGQEYNNPGSTSTDSTEFFKGHEFSRIRILWDGYLNRRGRFHIGFYAEGVLSDQPLFNNYTATLLQAASFTPIPESRTLFLRNYRAHSYFAGGIKTVTSITSRLELRLEAYLFQPHREILEMNDRTAVYGDPFANRYYMASAALVFHTPVAPVALSVNYFEREKDPISVIFTAGFLLFNRRAFD
jgi:NTE family protein